MAAEKSAGRLKKCSAGSIRNGLPESGRDRKVWQGKLSIKGLNLSETDARLEV